MSSEPVKIEVDCAVTPYSHHHLHHHHHHPSHHHHLHHATHIEEDEEEDDEFVDEDEDEDEDEVFMNGVTNSVAMNHHNHRHLDESSSSEEDRSSNDSGGGSSNNSDNIDEPQLQFQCATSHTITNPMLADVALETTTTTTNHSDNSSTTPTASIPVATLPSSTSNGSSESEDEEAGDDDDDDEEDEIVDEEEDDDEDDESDDENDSDDIVDPVGHQQYQSLTIGSKNHDYTNETSSVTTNSFNQFNNSDDEDADDDEDCEDDDEEDDDDDDDDEEDDDDISFDGTCDENANLNESSTSPDLVDGERMLEVTRKLVRSTERDPDRDLRKQVLLKTAIRKLPHFMEYNRYSDSFEQNLQLHSNNNNIAVNCLTPNQYYDHHQHIHLNHIDSQPKSYYHSVQPNAIQMSTTSLRMLDLNDDQEPADASNIETENPQSSYNSNNNNNDDNSSRTSLDHHTQQHDYANEPTSSQNPSYDQYNQTENNGPQSQSPNEHNHLNQHQTELTIHDLSPYNQHHEPATCRPSVIERHTTLDNLYQPMNGIDISDDMKTNDRTSVGAFHVACEGYDYTTDDNGEKKLFNDLDANNMSRIGHSNNYQNHLTTVDAYYMSNETTTTTTTRTPMKEIESNSTPTTDLDGSLRVDSVIVEGATSSPIDTDLILDGSGGSESSSNSSQCSTVSNESVNSSISQSNDSIDGPSHGSSILETSLNSTSDFYHDLHDSGVALYSPRSNKRSSSSIGLDDEMEVDHLTDLTSSTSAQSNSCIGQQNISQYKRLRKREAMD